MVTLIRGKSTAQRKTKPERRSGERKVEKVEIVKGIEFDKVIEMDVFVVIGRKRR